MAKASKAETFAFYPFFHIPTINHLMTSNVFGILLFSVFIQVICSRAIGSSLITIIRTVS